MTKRSRRLFARGYTIMEVMISLGVLTAGAAGVIALQKTVVVGNSSARNLVTANMIGATWLERMRDDARLWVSPEGVTIDSTTRWLKKAAGLTLGTSTGWFSPAIDSTAHYSYAADIFGTDIVGNDPSPQAFCTQVRLTPIYASMVRVEVRVAWERAGAPIVCATDDSPDTIANQFGRFGFVYTTSGVLRNGAGTP